MAKHQTAACRNQAGFTLVELAIVMIIIGLLIAGVLKGQALITNAQITTTVAQIQSIDAATTSFKDQYGGSVPGDMTNNTAIARIPNCLAAGACGINGNGDGRVGNGSLTFTNAPTGEQIGYWAQLAAAGLLSGYTPSTTTQTVGAWGTYAPNSKVSGGGFDVGWYAGGVTLAGLQDTAAATPAPAGEYLALHGNAGQATAANAADSFLTPNFATRIDTKMDDGSPNTGTVLAAGNGAAGANSCANGATAAGIYNESLTTAVCSLYIKFQN